MNKTESTVYQSPKASFVNASLDVIADPRSKYRSIKNGNNKGPTYITVSDLSQEFTVLNYNFGDILDEGAMVPRILVLNMPHDIRDIKVPAERKRVFFKTVLPLILETNKLILVERERILKIQAQKMKTGAVPAVDRLWLAALAARYKIKSDNLPSIIRRVDIIPPSMALAQAAEESGWGTSRFVLEGNALFGQYASTQAKHSLVPRDRVAGRDHSIRTFATLLDAVRSYAHNLNTHRAYRHFRGTRQTMRQNGEEIAGYKLIKQLRSYSERGKKYVSTIRSIITLNRLKNLDSEKIQADFILKNNHST